MAYKHPEYHSRDTLEAQMTAFQRRHITRDELLGYLTSFYHFLGGDVADLDVMFA